MSKELTPLRKVIAGAVIATALASGCVPEVPIISSVGPTATPSSEPTATPPPTPIPETKTINKDGSTVLFFEETGGGVRAGVAIIEPSFLEAACLAPCSDGDVCEEALKSNGISYEEIRATLVGALGVALGLNTSVDCGSMTIEVSTTGAQFSYLDGSLRVTGWEAVGSGIKR